MLLIINIITHWRANTSLGRCFSFSESLIVMIKKEYLEPSVEVIEMGYRDPVCQAASASGNVPDFTVDPYTPVWE